MGSARENSGETIMGKLPRTIKVKFKYSLVFVRFIIYLFVTYFIFEFDTT